MGFEPIRFVHVANPRLDQPLQETGPLPDAARPIVEEASFLSIEQIVSACIAHDVDFVLLTENCSSEHDCTLRAEVALRQGFGQLHERGIRVVVVREPTDDFADDQPDARWPANVTLLQQTDTEPVAVFREGKVIASVCAHRAMDQNHCHTVSSQTSTGSTRSALSPFLICVTPLTNRDEQLSSKPQDSLFELFDYVADSAPGVRRTVEGSHCLIHHPGSPQGETPRDTGAHGCTLVNVDQDRRMECTFIPSAPVRREHFTIDVDPQTLEEHLLQQMQESMRQLQVVESDRAWLIQWTLRGSGPLIEQLLEDQESAELLCRLHQVSPAFENVQIQHALRLLPDREMTTSGTEADGLSIHFLEALDKALPVTHDQLRNLLPTEDEHGQCALENLDSEQVATYARNYGLQWLET